MVREGRRRPGGTRPNLRWIVGATGTAPLDGPYALVTAGASLHWMSWQPTLTRLAAAMTPHAFLAIVEHGHRNLPWRAALTEVIVRHSRSRGYDPAFSLVDALCEAGLLELGRAGGNHADRGPPVCGGLRRALPFDREPGPRADDRG